MAGIAGILLAGGALLGGGDAPPPRAPVRLLSDVEEPRLVARLRELLLGAVPIFERETGRCLPENRVLVVNLHSTLKGYQRGARLAGVSGFMQVGAVTSWSDHESHLALQPRGDAAYLEAVGWLPDLTAQLALHEAAHQFLARAEVYPTLALPPWYSEGVADHLAEVAVRELLYTGGRHCLMLDDARRNVARAVATGHALPLAELFTLSELELDSYARRDLFYDQSAAVVRYLAGAGLDRWGGLFQAYLEELAGAGGDQAQLALLEGRARQRERWLELVADLPSFEEDWRGAVEPASAPWIERQGSSQWVGEDVLVTALAWQEIAYLQAAEPAPAGARRFEGQFALFGLDGAEAFVVLHEPEGEEGGLKLGLRGDGLVSLIGWRAGGVDTRVLRSGVTPRRDAFVRVAIEHDAGRLAVRLDDEPPLAFDVPAGYPPPGGGWGLGAVRDAVLWRGAGWR